MSLYVLLLIALITVSGNSQVLYGCDFEEECHDFVFDTYWMLNNTGGHNDHTYGNLSGHYATYNNESTSQPLTVFRTNGWIDIVDNMTTCFTLWFYTGPGGAYYTIELAQGDDLQARMLVGGVGFSLNNPDWRMTQIEMPFNNHYTPFIVFQNITDSFDIDDISYSICPSGKPKPELITLLNCNFDDLLCPDLISLPNYSYDWSPIMAELAQNMTPSAPPVDHSHGTSNGHYIWLNNLNSLQPNGVGYLQTKTLAMAEQYTAFCLSFYYYRFGSTSQTSELSVWVFNGDHEKSFAKIWPIKPNNYFYTINRWSWGYVSLPKGNYSVIFEMSSGDGQTSSFALDSINIASCGYLEYYLQNSSNMNYYCNFDSNCKIDNDQTNMDEKTFIMGSIRRGDNIDDFNLGPRTSSGWAGRNFFYWYHSKRNLSEIVNGQIRSPLIETNRKMCVQFSYFINSSRNVPSNDLVKIELITIGCRNETLWKVETDDSRGWQSVTIQLDNVEVCSKNFYYRINQGDQEKAAVAFDYFNADQCEKLPILTTTTTTTQQIPSGTTKKTMKIIEMSFLFFVIIFLQI